MNDASKMTEKNLECLAIFKDNCMKKMRDLVLLKHTASEQVHFVDLATKVIAEESEHKAGILKDLGLKDQVQLMYELVAMVGSLYKYSNKANRI